MSWPLFLVSALKLVIEVALLGLIGKALIHVLAGSRREQNVVYQLFGIVTRPAYAIISAMTANLVAARFHGIFAFVLLAGLWAALIVAKCFYCVTTVGACETACYRLLLALDVSTK